MRSLWLTFGVLGFQLTSSIDRRERKGRIEKNYVVYSFFAVSKLKMNLNAENAKK